MNRFALRCQGFFMGERKVEKTPEQLAEMKEKALNLQQDAVTAAYEYACECPLGDERIWAFTYYQNLRVASRI